MQDNFYDFLDKMDFAMAGATGCAISVGKPVHAIVFITTSFILAWVKRRKTQKKLENDSRE